MYMLINHEKLPSQIPKSRFFYYFKAAYYMESKQNVSRRDFLIFLRFDTRQDRGKYHSRKYKKSTVTEY